MEWHLSTITLRVIACALVFMNLFKTWARLIRKHVYKIMPLFPLSSLCAHTEGASCRLPCLHDRTDNALAKRESFCCIRRFARKCVLVFYGELSLRRSEKVSEKRTTTESFKFVNYLLSRGRAHVATDSAVDPNWIIKVNPLSPFTTSKLFEQSSISAKQLVLVFEPIKNKLEPVRGWWSNFG